MFRSWVLNEIWNTDLSSALVGMLLSSSKLFPLSKEVIVLGTALCYSHQECCLLYYLGETNSGIHMYEFTFKPLHFCFWMSVWCVLDLNKNFGGLTDLAQKRHGSADLHTPIHPPYVTITSQLIHDLILTRLYHKYFIQY